MGVLPSHGLRRQRSLQAIQPRCRSDHGAAGGGHQPRRLEPDHRPGRRVRGRGWCDDARSPYRLRLRFDRAVAARYLRFSAPILLTVVAAMLIAQGQILAIKLHDGLAAAGFITLAVTLSRYIDRADQIVTATIYPAICAIQNQRAALHELYVKSNRATLMWVLPYAVGVILFAPDLVHFVLGDAGPARSSCSRVSRSSARSRSSGSTGSRSTGPTATPGRRRSSRSSAAWRSSRSRSPACCSTVLTASSSGVSPPR